MATKKASSSSKTVSKKKITEDDIRKKAQKIFEARMKKVHQVVHTLIGHRLKKNLRSRWVD